ncbi:hypothetical protein [Conservatibacter flavescens]|uniref:Uncharacterized protein n=1 Tax=Conservatibacter flavescens TaxID=28161 RepID=A0A2M8S111_9PAST|nr:hypothetical protein [Conservatibacter flavescens]PJG84786.1 hypothetical protein CVP05_09620 [Conservatibacter flavescens]
MKLTHIFNSLINLILIPVVLITFLVIILWRPFTLFQAIEIVATKLNKWFENIAYIELYIQLDSNGLTQEQFEQKIYLEMKKLSWFDFIWLFMKQAINALQRLFAKKYSTII